MTWVRLEDTVPLHPKVLRLSDGAFRLWVTSLAFANRAITNGRIEKDLVGTLNHHGKWSSRQLSALVSELVSAGLWVDCGDHFEIHDYDHHQAEAMKDRVERRKEYEREKKRRQREDKDRSKAAVPTGVPAGHPMGHTTGSRPVSSVPTRPDPSRPDPSLPSVEPGSRERATAAAPPAHVESFERALAPTTAVHKRIESLVSETRQAAGGAPFRMTAWADREAVQKFAEWASGTGTTEDGIRAVLVAFWAAKGTGARLSWLVDEEPGRFLGDRPTRRQRGVAPPATHAQHAADAAARGEVFDGF